MMKRPTIVGLVAAFALALNACAAPAAAPATQPPAAPPTAAPVAAPTTAPAAAASAAPAAKPTAAPAVVGPSPSVIAAAQPPPNLGTFKFGASSPETSNLPVWLAIEQGFYTKYGVTVEYVGTGVGDTTVAALTSGDVAAAILGPSNLAGAVASGSDLRSYMGVYPGMPYLLVVDPSINKVEDLRGKVFAIANIGGSGSVASEILLNQYGMKSGQDVTLINFGSPPTRIESVKAGQAAGTLVTGTTLSKLGNLKMLADLRDGNVPFQAAAITMSLGFVKSKPQVAEALIKGTWEGTRMLLDPAKQAVVTASIKSHLSLSDAAAADSYKETIKDFHAALPPRVSQEGVQRIIEVLAKTDSRLAKLKATDVIDSSIMDKLIKEGF